MNDVIELNSGIVLRRIRPGEPEQYDAFHGPVRVGYLRLRDGHFTAECPDAGGTPVYIGQAATGTREFQNSRERAMHLVAAAEAIAKWVDRTREITTDG